MLLWGGESGGFGTDGAAFDPRANTWRSISPAPFTSEGRPIAVWTGAEMIVLAGFNSDRAAAYDPGTDRWRTLPNLPGRLQAPSPSVSWTGEQIVTVVQDPQANATRIVSLDPTGDEWESLPSFGTGLTVLASTGQGILAASGNVAAVLEGTARTWKTLANAPNGASIGDPSTAWTGTELLLWDGDQASVIDPRRGSWSPTPAGDLGQRVQPAAVWADGVFIAWGGFPDHDDGIMLRPTDDAAPDTNAPPSPGEAVATCFPDPFPAHEGPTSPREVDIASWPQDAPALSVLAGNGELWVVDDGMATAWTTNSSEGTGAPGYLWARWEPGGTILASRLVDAPEIRLERLSGPEQATVAADLPFTVSDHAPAGYCPIDGYLATFAVGPSGVTLVRHHAGPLPHGCPAGAVGDTSTTDQWRCASPEGTSFEPRPGDLTANDADTGMFIGSAARLVADATQAPAYAILQGDDIEVVRPGSQPDCCYGGQHGSAFSLAPHGDRLAYTPDGQKLMIAGLDPGGSEQVVWESPDRISATAFDDRWLAVAHGNHVSLITPDGTETLLPVFAATPITTLDWAG
jgi:hypothetical protein